MISIKHNITDSYGQYGLKHFLFKYGILAKIKDGGEADIEIRCGYSEGNDTGDRILVKIPPAKIQREVKGYLKMGGETLPLFETPRELKVAGKAMATFHSEGVSYPCITLNNNCLLIGFDLFGEIGRILGGDLESIFDRQAICAFVHSKSPSGHLNAMVDKQDRESKMLMKIPVVDVLEELLFQSLRPICQEKGVELKAKPFWPDGKKFALCLSHDVDRAYKTYQYLPLILRYLKRGDLSAVAKQIKKGVDLPSAARQIKSMLFERGKNNPYWTFDKIMNLENELGVKSTFYFINETDKLNPFSLTSRMLFGGWNKYKIDSLDIVEIIRKLHSEGFEIGVHGSYYSYNNESLLRNEKARLEEILGDSVHGIRQHYLNFDPENTFKMQESVGFEYDTTLGFREGIGFRRGTCFPYHPFDFSSNGELPILEIPLLIMDGAIPGDKAILEQCIEIMDIVERSNGVLTLLWHQDRFSELDSPGWTELYKKLVIEAINRNAWITTPHELYRWLVHERESA